jgi:hypothetical protein
VRRLGDERYPCAIKGDVRAELTLCEVLSCVAVSIRCCLLYSCEECITSVQVLLTLFCTLYPETFSSSPYL